MATGSASWANVGRRMPCSRNRSTARASTPVVDHVARPRPSVRGRGTSKPARRRRVLASRVRGVPPRPVCAGRVSRLLVQRLAAAQARGDADDGRQLAHRSACGRPATGPRRRGRASTPREPSGQASAWRTPASYTWNQWKPASSCSRAWPRAAISSAASTRRRAGSPRRWRRPGRRRPGRPTPRPARRGRRPSASGRRAAGHVQEAVEVDAERPVQHAPQQLGRRRGGTAPGGARWRW